MMRFYAGYAYPMMGAGPGWIIMAVLCVLLIVVAVYVFVRLAHGDHFRFEHKNTESVQENAALKILDERYAKGEISDEEYKAKKANLQ